MSLSIKQIKQNASNPNGQSNQNKSINSQLEEAGFNPYYIQRAAVLPSSQIKNAIRLKQAGFDDSYCVENANKSEEQLNIALQSKNAGFKDYFAIKCCDLLPEEYDNALILKEAGFQDIEAIDASKLPKEQVGNGISLKKAGFEGRYAIHGARTLNASEINSAINLKAVGFGDSTAINHASSLSKEQIDMTIKLKQLGFSDFHSVQGAKSGTEQANIAIKLKNLGYTDAKAIEEASLFSMGQIDSLVQYVKLGFNLEDAQNIVLNDDDRSRFEELAKKSYDEKTSAIMVNIENNENYDDDVMADFLTSINATKPSEERTSAIVSKFLEDNPDVNIKDLTEYINSIDMETVSEIAPAVKDFGPKEHLKFGFYHYRAGTTDFTKETLSVDEDFTQYLTENYIDADMLTDLLTAFPATPREVGSIPEDWLVNLPETQRTKAIEDVYNVISIFQETSDTKKFSEQMSAVLDKQVDVTELSSGTFGTGYRISVEDAKDLCIKIFPKHLETRNKTPNMHGQHVEVQNGIFANTHSSDFVKMYFGRVAAHKHKDGFLVTQFLGNNIIPVITGKPQGEYKVTSGDCFMGHNIINGKNIDFGGMIVEKDGVRLNNWV